jgi:hypothetical protein
MLSKEKILPDVRVGLEAYDRFDNEMDIRLAELVYITLLMSSIDKIFKKLY